MPDVDRQLIQRITQQVLRALSNEPPPSESGRQGVNDPSAASSETVKPRQDGSGSSDAPATVHPAIGVCTGDYGQFIDRPDLTAGAGRQHNQPRPPGGVRYDVEEAEDAASAAARPAPRGGGSFSDPLPQIGPVLSGFVTAKQVDAAPGDKLLLDAGAKLTPLAEDRVRERGMAVRRASPLAGRRGTSGAANAASAASRTRAGRPATAPWLWHAEGHCPAVRAIAGGWRDRLVRAAGEQSVEPLASIIMRIARETSAGRASGAILFVRAAAAATCFANRCRSLRAIVGACPEAADQGVSELAANVLIIEYPYHDRARMEETVRRFIDAERPALPEVDRRLRELEQCA